MNIWLLIPQLLGLATLLVVISRAYRRLVYGKLPEFWADYFKIIIQVIPGAYFLSLAMAMPNDIPNWSIGLTFLFAYVMLSLTLGRKSEGLENKPE